jgi:hypothetical protein
MTSEGAYWTGEGLAPDEARWRLAEYLYQTMEASDPSDGRKWSDLDEHERGFYGDTIATLLDLKGLVRVALE